MSLHSALLLSTRAGGQQNVPGGTSTFVCAGQEVRVRAGQQVGVQYCSSGQMLMSSLALKPPVNAVQSTLGGALLHHIARTRDSIVLPEKLGRTLASEDFSDACV